MARRAPFIAALAVLSLGTATLAPVNAAAVIDAVTGIDRPRGIAVTADYVYVTSNNESPGNDVVTVIDADTRAIVTTIAVGDAPGNIVLNPSGTKAYVANTYSDTISVITLATNTVTNTITVGDYPVGIVFSPDGATAYVSNYVGHSVSSIDTDTEAATTIALSSGFFPGFPQGMAMSPDGGEIYITDTNSDVVGVYTVATNSYEAQAFATGNYPNVVKVSTDGTRLYIVNNGDPTNGTISVFDRTTRALIDTISVGGGYPDDLLVTPDAIYVTVAAPPSELVKIDQASLEIVSRVPVPSARGMGRTADGNVWVSQLDVGSVAIVGTEVTRVAGANRYESAVDISEASFPDPTAVSTVYVAAGANYPDALAAGPVAAKAGAPVLLTRQDALPQVVADEITRLDPDSIVIVGATGSVSAAVESALNAIAPTTRISGANRFATGRALVASKFGAASANAVYLANGLNFPDALSGGGVAAAGGAPIILVNGTLGSLDADTLDLISSIAPTDVHLLGGPSSVSNGIQIQLDGLGYDVTRYAGANRYETSRLVNEAAFDQATNVVFATGATYPDALAGTPFAAIKDAPVYLVRKDCIPPLTLEELDRLNTAFVTVLGGPSTVSDNVMNLGACAN